MQKDVRQILKLFSNYMELYKIWNLEEKYFRNVKYWKSIEYLKKYNVEKNLWKISNWKFLIIFKLHEIFVFEILEF